MSRYGPNNGGPPPAFAGARGPPAGPAFYGGGPPPRGAMFPPRGPVMGAFPPHAQARPAGVMAVPPMAMLARGFPGPRPMITPPVAYPRQVQQAPVLPAGWSEHYTPQNQRYYYNAATGVSTYELPTAAAVHTSAPATTTATATWIEYTDDSSGQTYYYNTVTKATTWDEPEEYRMQQARAEVEKMKSSTEANGAVVAEEQTRKEQKKRQADEEAMKMYDAMPKDDRVAAFKAFLEEKQVSSQFKWQETQRFMAKEGLDKDPRWRFALSTVGEKKQAFSEYCTQAEKKQNIERRRQAKRVREEYLELLVNIEEKVASNRVTWDDLNDGAEFFGLRKDPRWQAIEEVKDKKDLFEGFVQDALRKKTQLKAKLAEEFRGKFVAKLREKSNDPVERTYLAGKRRLDSDLKKKVWQYFDEVEGAADVRDVIPKHDVYDWTEQYLDVLKAEESQLQKAEREKKKKLEETFTAKIEEVVEAWLQSEKIGMNTSWKEIGEAITKECLPGESDDSALLSERRRRRVFEKKVKKAREEVGPAVAIVQPLLDKAIFVVSPTSTFDDFSAALKRGVEIHLESNKPEEGEEEETPAAEGNPQTHSADKQELLLQLERAVQNAEMVTFPLTVKHVFQLLQYQAQRAKSFNSGREPSRSPSPSSWKRRRSSLDSPRRSRSPSRHRSRSRSRSRSHSAAKSRRTRSRSQSRDPRAALAATSYGNLPTATSKRFQPAMPTAVPVVRAMPVVNETARTEEIIRQARLKLQAKQEAKQQGAAVDSEPEEGEEMEDGEVEE